MTRRVTHGEKVKDQIIRKCHGMGTKEKTSLVSIDLAVCYLSLWITRVTETQGVVNFRDRHTSMTKKTHTR